MFTLHKDTCVWVYVAQVALWNPSDRWLSRPGRGTHSCWWSLGMSLSESSSWLYSKCCWGRLARGAAAYSALIKAGGAREANSPTPTSPLPLPGRWQAVIYEPANTAHNPPHPITFIWLESQEDSKVALQSLLKSQKKKEKNKQNNIEHPGGSPSLQALGFPKTPKPGDIFKFLSMFSVSSSLQWFILSSSDWSHEYQLILYFFISVIKDTRAFIGVFPRLMIVTEAELTRRTAVLSEKLQKKSQQ